MTTKQLVDRLVAEHLSLSGETMETLHPIRRKLVEDWKVQLLDFFVIGPKRGRSAKIFKGKTLRVYHPEILVVGKDEEGKVFVSRQDTWENIESYPESLQKTALVDISETDAQYQARWFGWRYLFNNSIMIVEDGRPIVSSRIEGYLPHIVAKYPELTFTKEGWLVDGDWYDQYIRTLAFPGTDMSNLNKLLGGRMSLEDQTIIGKASYVPWKYIKVPGDHATILIGSPMPVGEIKSRSGKIVSSRLKGMYVYDPAIPENTMMVPEGAIKGDNWEIGWHLTEVHEIVGFWNDKAKTNIGMYTGIYQIHFNVPSIVGKMAEKLELVQRLLLNKASIKETQDFLHLMKGELTVIQRDRVTDILDMATGMPEVKWLSQVNVRATVKKVAKIWLSKLEVEVPTLQGKALCSPDLKPGCVYFSQMDYDLARDGKFIDRDGNVFVTGNPFELVLKLKARITNTESACFGIWAHPDTYATIGRDDDGDHLNLVRPHQYCMFSYTYAEAKAKRQRVLDAFDKYIGSQGGFQSLPVTAMDKPGMIHFILTAYTSSIGVFDNALKQFTMQMAMNQMDNFDLFMESWWTLFQFKNVFIDCKKAAMKTLKGKRVEVAHFWHLAKKLVSGVYKPQIQSDSVTEFYAALAPEGPVHELFTSVFKDGNISVDQNVVDIGGLIADMPVSTEAMMFGNISKEISRLYKVYQDLTEFDVSMMWVLQNAHLLQKVSFMDLCRQVLIDGANIDKLFSTRAHIMYRLHKIDTLYKSKGLDFRDVLLRLQGRISKVGVFNKTELMILIDELNAEVTDI